MARLKSHGRELLRIEQESNVNDPDGIITWRKHTRTYHSDGQILQKLDVRFAPSPYRPAGEFYSYGWKLYAKLKKEVSPAEHVAKKVALIRSGESKWTLVTGGGPAPFILDTDKIMRAAQSDEMVGFCKECGEEAHGVEPDARNYRCESCGAMAVYGAEELLIGA